MEKNTIKKEIEITEKIIAILAAEGITVDMAQRILERSKDALLASPVVPVYEEGVKHKFSGYRETRGMYKRKGMKGNDARINSDVQGSYNILRKVKPNLFTREVIEALQLVPRRVSLGRFSSKVKQSTNSTKTDGRSFASKEHLAQCTCFPEIDNNDNLS